MGGYTLGYGEGVAATAGTIKGRQARVGHEWGVVGRDSAAFSHCEGNKAPRVAVQKLECSKTKAKEN